MRVSIYHIACELTASEISIALIRPGRPARCDLHNFWTALRFPTFSSAEEIATTLILRLSRFGVLTQIVRCDVSLRLMGWGIGVVVCVCSSGVKMSVGACTLVSVSLRLMDWRIGVVVCICGSGVRMSIGARTLMSIHSPYDFLCIRPQASDLVCAFQKHSL